jgi:hypothetical protein
VEPPRKLGPAGRRVWRVGRDALEAVAVDVALVAPTLERLARLADVLALAEKRWADAGRPLTAPGSKGQDAPHALLRVQADVRRQIADHEKALGLTPASRSAIGPSGWARGHARSPDRQMPPRRGARVVPLRLSDDVERAIGDADAG